MADFKNVRVVVVHREGEKDWEKTGRLSFDPFLHR